MKHLMTFVSITAIAIAVYLLFLRTDEGPESEHDIRQVRDSESEDSDTPPSRQVDKLTPVLSDLGDAEYAWVRNASVTIPGSEPIPVELKRVIIVHPPYFPTDNFLDQYQSLADRARDGDAAAARMIAKALQTCSLINRDENSHLGTAHAEGYRSSEVYCKDVTDDLAMESKFWAKLAAEGGDYLGIQTYAHMLGAGSERLALMERFWEDGNISALPTLSGGFFDGSHGDSTSQPDYIRAYAYHLIYSKVHESTKNVASGATSPAGAKVGSSIAIENHLRYLGGFLSSQQQIEAEKLAAGLLSRNSNCCIGSL